MTSTSIPRTVRLLLAVLIPGLDQLEQLVEPFVTLGQYAADGVAYPPLLHRVSYPVGWLVLHDRLVDGDSLLLGQLEVNEGTPTAIVSPGRIDGVRLTPADLSGERNQLLQVFLVAERFLLPLSDQ